MNLAPGRPSPSRRHWLHPCFWDRAIQRDQCGYCTTKPEVENSRFWGPALKLQMQIAPLPCRQYNPTATATTLVFWGPAIHQNLWEYSSIEPEVEKSKMAATKLQMHESSLSDKITIFQRLHLYFGVLHSNGTINADTVPPNWKWIIFKTPNAESSAATLAVPQCFICLNGQ